MRPETRTVSLRTVVTAVLCAGILLVSVIHIWLGYEGMKTGVLLATQTSARHLAESVNQSIRSMMIPSGVMLRLLRHDSLTSAPTFEDRIRELPMLGEALDSNPICTAVYIGYENGDFFMLSRFTGGNVLVVEPAPEGTRFLLQSITRQADGSRLTELRFYGPKLDLLEERTLTNYDYDPRTRPWYRNALLRPDSMEITMPYIFYSIREIGVTLTAKNARGNSVVALDATAGDLSKFLHGLTLTTASEVVIVDPDGNVFAWPNLVNALLQEGDGYRLPKLEKLGVPALDNLHRTDIPDNVLTRFSDGKESWYGFRAPVYDFANNQYRILIAIPGSELLAGIRSNVVRQGFIAAGAMAALLLAGWYVGARLARPLRVLTEQVNALAEFDFRADVGVPTHIREVRRLGGVLGDMAQTIRGFQSLALALNRETDLERMLGSVLDHLLDIVQLESGSICLYDEKKGLLIPAVSKGSDPVAGIPVSSPQMTDEQLLSEIENVSGRNDISAVLRNRSQNIVGLLHLRCGNSGACFSRDTLISFVNEISGAAAVAIETRQLIHNQKALLDSFITLMADAIDTKSPYTGGHCRRVPVLAEMIMEALLRSEEAPFVGYAMTPAQREEFHVAAWLHDFGKITTPEYVVDKATKLETIYNRIHELRTRFEVLHRDATIACLEAVAKGEDAERAAEVRDAEHARLQEAFAFVADCNIGGESMKDEDVEQLARLARRTWLRHFDDRLGLSKDELARMPEKNADDASLPATEHLLADKPFHLVPWGYRFPPVHPDDPRNVWGFDMEAPEYMYNYGEIYNLSVPKGTLTPEERFKINDHIVQTICMLSSLPFPAEFAAVPRIAGNHHERMDGNGYPRRIPGEAMSIPERVMAVADIFEALTARDRPYKDGKTLSQAMTILSRMARTGHVDKDIFNLFLHSGVYAEYAEQYLSPHQIDRIEVEAFAV